MTTAEIISEFELKLAAFNTDEERCDVIYKSNLWMVDFDAGKKYSGILFEIAQRSQSHKLLSWAYCSCGILRCMDSEYLDALNDLNMALAYLQPGDDSTKAKVYSCMGIIYLYTYLPEEAIENFEKAIALFDKMGDLQTKYSTMQNLAGAYMKAGIKDKGIEILLDIINREEGQSARTYLSVSAYYMEQKDFAKVEEFLKLAEGKLTGTYVGTKIALLNGKSELALELKRFGEAWEYIQQAVELNKTYSRPYLNLMVSNWKAKFYLSKGDFEIAEQTLLEGLNFARQQHVKQNITYVLELLKELYVKLGNKSRAFDYAEEYILIEKELKEDKVKTMQKMLDVKQKFAVVQKEKEVTEEKNRVIEIEKQKSEALLLNILPAEVAEELKAKGSADAKLFDEVTVIYTDFVSFTKVSQRLTPQQLVDELNVCFKAFDEIIGRYNIEKIKTMGDGFIAAAGLPVANANHAADMVSAALEIQAFITNRVNARSAEAIDGLGEIRVGIHSGPVVAGIVGVKKFAYDIWGDTVNTAARMEQKGEAGKINISEATYQLVKDKFNCQYRGEIEAKNKGLLKMYFVEPANNHPL